MAIFGLTCLALALAYAVVMLLAVVVWEIRTWFTRPATGPALPPISILKPLCGAEPELYGQLRSFCIQDYPEYQVIFGTRDATDAALVSARRLQAELPHVSIDIVIDPQQHGGNRKASNLTNMLVQARHEVLAVADSDTFARPDYLRTVVAPLLNDAVGLVTSTYRGTPTPGLWSRLGAMYVNDWYMPSVLLTWLFGYRGYASGQTLCLRRSTLEGIGGFRAIANHLADDYRLGELVRGLGLRIVLSPARVTVAHDEPSFAALEHHEMRWMRTLRVLRPLSFRLLFLSFSVSMAAVGLLACAAASAVHAITWALVGGTLMARLGLHLINGPRGRGRLLSDLWLLVVRDLLLCWVWVRTFFLSRVVWRDHEFNVSADGVIQQEH
ncbi:MAG: bacteriohopanetetrol glucosamine biosynthesis glycosyltransferase HpnI [Steroidobacteraceae bacterium]